MADKTERELIEAARNKMRKVEAAMAGIIADLKGVAKINAEADQARLSNAAFGVAADFTIALGLFMKTHADGTNVLLDSWPNYADIVTDARGPGR